MSGYSLESDLLSTYHQRPFLAEDCLLPRFYESPLTRKQTLKIAFLSGINRLSAQPIDATQALNRSAGVSTPNALRDRSFNRRATPIELCLRVYR